MSQNARRRHAPYSFDERMVTIATRAAALDTQAAGPPSSRISRLGARPRTALVLALAATAVLALAIVVAATLGPARIAVQTSAGVLLDLIGLSTAWGAEATDTQRQIVLQIPLPRILTAVLVGAGLALVGP